MDKLAAQATMGQATMGLQGTNAAVDVVEIAAPRESVLATLFDFAGWGAWNPLYPEARGTMTAGETVEFAVKLEGLKPNRGTARVLEADREAGVIRYEIVAMGGLTRATRIIAVETPAPGTTRVTNGEVMGGLIGRLLFRAMGEKVRRGLAAMNGALKQKLEAAD